MAVDTTLVNSLQRDGQPRPGADARPGLALAQAAARKHRNPELQPGGRGRCRFVVFDLKVGGRFSRGGLALLRRLARACARAQASWAQTAADRALAKRWNALAALRCAHAAQTADASDGVDLPVDELLVERL